ncbi:hypothetical protein BC628DRAFT_37395 [Trametes gibbosa]|nr:hypothetical protein BC628DRAFT_37395 [Trametes gibbosa]
MRILSLLAMSKTNLTSRPLCQSILRSSHLVSRVSFSRPKCLYPGRTSLPHRCSVSFVTSSLQQSGATEDAKSPGSSSTETSAANVQEVHDSRPGVVGIRQGPRRGKWHPAVVSVCTGHAVSSLLFPDHRPTREGEAVEAGGGAHRTASLKGNFGDEAAVSSPNHCGTSVFVGSRFTADRRLGRRQSCDGGNRFWAGIPSYAHGKICEGPSGAVLFAASRRTQR